MQKFVIFSLVALFLTGAIRDYVTTSVNLLPDLIAAIAVYFILGAILKNKSLAISPKYIVYFSIFAVYVAIGWIINDISSGAIVAGIRVYLKGFIFFWVPIVYSFTERELRQQLFVFIGLGLLQTPVTLWQRFIEFAHRATGDVVVGTLGQGAGRMLSIVLSYQAVLVTTFYVKKYLTRRFFILLLLFLALPTMLNDTKAMAVFIPLILFLPFVFGSEREYGYKQFIGPAIGVVALFAIFVTAYNFVEGKVTGRGEFNRFFSIDTLGEYLAPHATNPDTEKKPGKLDKLIIPMVDLSEDPVKLLVGLGLGNTFATPVDMLKGDHVDTVQGLVGGGISRMVWETGVIGLILFSSFIWLVYQDAKVISRRNGMVGVMGVSMRTMFIVIVVAVLYANIFAYELTVSLFWYFAGLTVSTRWRVAAEKSGADYPRVAATT